MSNESVTRELEMESDTTPKATRVTHHAELEDSIFATPGGLQDEDEEIEREVALSSPVKAGKRLTANVSARTALLLIELDSISGRVSSN